MHLALRDDGYHSKGWGCILMAGYAWDRIDVFTKTINIIVLNLYIRKINKNKTP
jgi:hypothetical protein